MKCVTAFRPLPLEADHHKELHDFDWMDAIQMLSDSIAATSGCTLRVLTDVDTTLPFPMLRYATVQRRLMLWYLEIAACYLESDAFDEDTVFLDADQLVYGDLSRWFVPYMDLGICIRKPPKGYPALLILNGVQFWAVKAKDRLAAFYRRALALAETLPEPLLKWGADTVALEQLLAPLDVGLCRRGDVRVRLLDAEDIIEAFSSTHIRHLEVGKMRQPMRPVLDFRNTRKPYMRPVYEATIGKLATP